MGKAKKAVGKAIGGGGSKPKAQKAPKVMKVAPEVVSESSNYKPQMSQGRQAQGNILDPMMAQEDEKKDILG